MSRPFFSFWIGVGLTWATLSAEELPNPAEVFEQRIMPIFRSSDPSSCIQCHLSSVDLKEYILPSSRETFLSLRDQSLIDVDRPRQSKILHLIEMGNTDPDSLAVRLHAKTRQAEYEAFAAWIEACCKDPELVDAAPLSSRDSAGPSKSLEVIRHTRKDRVLDSFVRNVWSQRMRCFPCHTPAELDPENPMHAKPIERYQEFVAKYGRRMDVFKESPEKTLQAMVISSRKRHGDNLPLINREDPLQSLLLLKPMSKLPPKDADGQLGAPSSAIPVSHMGGIKIHKDDFSYKAFAAWLQDYANSVSGEYGDRQTLPDDNWYPTEHVIRVTNLPSHWPNLATVQLFLYSWDAEKESWSEKPIAFTQGILTPRKIVNGSLFVLAEPRERDRLRSEGETLAPRRVQLRLFLDHTGAIEKEPTTLLDGSVPDASLEIEARFEQGFAKADVVDGSQLTYRD